MLTDLRARGDILQLRSCLSDRTAALGEEKFWELSQRLVLSRGPWGLLEGSSAHLDQFHGVSPCEEGFLGREGLH